MLAQRIKNKIGGKLRTLNVQKFAAEISGANTQDLSAKGYEYFLSQQLPFYAPWEKDDEFKKMLDEAYKIGFPPRKEDPDFVDEAFIERGKQQDTTRRYNAYSLAKSALSVKGDFAEFGVHRGITTHILARLCDSRYAPDRAIWGIDSFEGVSEPNEEDISVFGHKRWKKGSLKYDNYEYLKNELSKNKTTVHLIKGWIPEILAQCDVKQLAFAYVDVDLYEPTRASIEFAYPKMTTGGIMVFDDYGNYDCPGARKAVDEFFAGKENVLPLIDGYSFVIKR